MQTGGRWSCRSMIFRRASRTTGHGDPRGRSVPSESSSARGRTAKRGRRGSLRTFRPSAPLDPIRKRLPDRPWRGSVHRGQVLDEVPEKQGAALQVFLVVTRELKGDRISRVQVEDCDGIPRASRVEVAAAIDHPNKARLFENVHLAMDRLPGDVNAKGSFVHLRAQPIENL